MTLTFLNLDVILEWTRRGDLFPNIFQFKEHRSSVSESIFIETIQKLYITTV